MQPETIVIPDALALTADITEKALSAGGIGAVVGRAGVGKTPLIVQLALHAMLQNHNALHINLSETVQKTDLWYREICSRLTDKYKGPGKDKPADKTLFCDRFFNRRFIMTLKVSGFSVDAIRERVQDLKTQDVFAPDLLVIDGLSFDSPQRETVEQLRELSRSLSVRTWITVGAHREEKRDDLDRPARMAEIADLLDLAWELVPDSDNGRIYIKSLSCGQDDAEPSRDRLFMEPSSMLLNVIDG
ncbi:MAG: AAA family ATPase [Desulfosudaceae bacterium]